MEFHHIGVACREIGRELARIKALHAVRGVSGIVYDEEQRASLCMVEVEDGLRIELISGEQVETMLKRRISYYHVCYQVEDLDAKVAEWTAGGALLIAAPKPAVLFGGRRVAFLQAGYGLVELLEA